MAVAMKPTPVRHPRNIPPDIEEMPRDRISTARTTDVIRAVKKLTTKGVGDGLMSSAFLPMAASHAFPNNGPYHKPPSINPATVAASTASQFRPEISNMSSAFINNGSLCIMDEYSPQQAAGYLKIVSVVDGVAVDRLFQFLDYGHRLESPLPYCVGLPLT
jgi:hypothetical protein